MRIKLVTIKFNTNNAKLKSEHLMNSIIGSFFAIVFAVLQTHFFACLFMKNKEMIV